MISIAHHAHRQKARPFALPALLFVATVLAAASPAVAQRGLTNIPDPDPQKELERLRVPEGFEINLFASDPDIAKPIQMNWDAKGRLWLATSSVYPQLLPGEVADDKIMVLEDQDGDGKADKHTVFADGLLIPTGILPIGDGAYVANSTELLYMRDTDGDGKADSSEVVLSGFGTEDTHHILHTFRHGLDGRIYFNQSIYIHSNIETPLGPKRLDGGGIWRFKPNTLDLDVWVRGFVNPWGHRFNKWGQEFATDGAFGEGVNYVFPGATFVTAVGAERILHGLSPGQPKHCGLEILDGSHLPEDYRGTFVANDFRGNRVNRFEIEPSRSGYVARQLDDLVWTDHVAFRPVDISMGPDGAIYIADWYNPIIQHGEVDFRDERRDRARGRIWRITAKNRPLVKPPQLTDASAEQLVTALVAPERWTRDMARQMIGQRGAQEMEAPLRKALNGASTDSPEGLRRLLETMWAFQNIDVTDEALLNTLLHCDSHEARAAATRVAADWSAAIPDPRELLSERIADEHPQVRLEAINALRRFGDADAVKRALAAVDQPLDENLDYALWLTCRELQSEWLPVVQENPNFFGSIDRLVFALKAAGNADALKPALALWDSGTLTPQEQSAVSGVIARTGGPAELNRFSDPQRLNDPKQQPIALFVLLTAARERNAAPSEHREALLEQLKSAARSSGGQPSDGQPSDGQSAEAIGSMAELAGRWKLAAAPQTLMELLRKNPAEPVVAGALAGLTADARPEAKNALAKLAGSDVAPEIQARAIAALASVAPRQAAPLAVKLLEAKPTDANVTMLVAGFITVKGGPEILAEALADKQLPETVAAAALRRVSTSTQTATRLADALRKAGNLQPIDQEMSAEQIASLVERVRNNGDPHRGQQIYRRENLQCVKCHAIGGAGGAVGPDLTSIGASAPTDYLIESLVKPSAKIKEGYHTVTLITAEGNVISGILLRKTDEETVLRDGNGKEIAIPASDIEEQVMSPVSLMPVGLLAKLPSDELVDMISFLGQLGKTGEYRVPTARYVRNWRAYVSSRESSAKLRANGAQALARAPQDFTWQNVTSLVNGQLPLDEVPQVDFFAGQKFQILQFPLTTAEAGQVTLRLPNAQGVTGYVSGEPLEIHEETTVNLPEGQTVITLLIDRGQYHQPTISVELVDAPGSAARAAVGSF